MIGNIFHSPQVNGNILYRIKLALGRIKVERVCVGGKRIINHEQLKSQFVWPTYWGRKNVQCHYIALVYMVMGKKSVITKA